MKFGFLAVLYLFLLWVARSALRDLRAGAAARRRSIDAATGFHSATGGPLHTARRRAPGRRARARATRRG